MSSHVTALTSGQTLQLFAPSLYFPAPQSDFQSAHFPSTKALLVSVHKQVPAARSNVKAGVGKVTALHVVHAPVLLLQVVVQFCGQLTH